MDKIVYQRKNLFIINRRGFIQFEIQVKQDYTILQGGGWGSDPRGTVK